MYSIEERIPGYYSGYGPDFLIIPHSADSGTGFDLVGDENVANPLTYYIEPLLRFRQRVTDLGLDIPFILHAGETYGDGSPADCNVYDAVLLGTKRIGHG